MTHRRALNPLVFALALALPLAVGACGKPAAPDGGDDDFAQAGLQGQGGPLVDGKSLELVSWLVQFNRLNTPEKLEGMLNKTPGKFVPVDADGDGSHDYIGVREDPKPKRDSHALVLSARANADASEDDAVRIATLFFDEDWGLTGYERAVGSRPTSPTTIAAAAGSAASIAASEQASAKPAAAIADEPPPAPTEPPPADDPVAEAAPGKAGGAPSVVAVPAGSEVEPGLQAAEP